jgi:hypothetical protein
MTLIGSPVGVADLLAAAVVAAAAAGAVVALDGVALFELPHAARARAVTVIAAAVTLRTRRLDDALVFVLT